MKKIIIYILVAIVLGNAAYSSGYNHYAGMQFQMYYTALTLITYEEENGFYPTPHNEPPYGLEALTTPTPFIGGLLNDVFSVKQNLSERPFIKNRTLIVVEYILLISLLGLLIFLIVIWIKKYPIKVTVFIVPFSIGLFSIVCIFLHDTISQGLFDLSSYYTFLFPKKYPAVMFFLVPMEFPKGEMNTFYYGMTKDRHAFLWSRGPDFVSQFQPTDLNEMNSIDFVNSIVTYSPTNGMTSAGDVWIAVEGATNPNDRYR